MGYFRKKPVVVEAWRNIKGAASPKWVADVSHEQSDGALIVHTLEGPRRAAVDDWIIKGVKSEVYPCKHDIFVETYEQVSGPDA